MLFSNSELVVFSPPTHSLDGNNTVKGKNKGFFTEGATVKCGFSTLQFTISSLYFEVFAAVFK